ncbi:MAG TPA: hypothetical protein VMO26_00960 [Vicinamibacterales bacterium]|nr:hypothetical protein [Vicinamibacterales bacterium]
MSPSGFEEGSVADATVIATVYSAGFSQNMRAFTIGSITNDLLNGAYFYA